MTNNLGRDFCEAALLPAAIVVAMLRCINPPTAHARFSIGAEKKIRIMLDAHGDHAPECPMDQDLQWRVECRLRSLRLRAPTMKPCKLRPKSLGV
jgi:hypothetical protein